MFSYDKVKHIGRELLIALGENPDREGLLDTPRRFADMWQEFIEFNPGKIETVFESVQVNQMVVISGMRVWSLCEHHLLPFFCDVSIGYIADKKILGLSKFGRIAQLHAHKLQLQERLITDIADECKKILSTDNVAVLGRGEHLCMTMRGVKMPSLMTSSCLNGEFINDPIVRSEFLSLVLAK